MFGEWVDGRGGFRRVSLAGASVATGVAFGWNRRQTGEAHDSSDVH
jgi:hypothetical protein